MDAVDVVLTFLNVDGIPGEQLLGSVAVRGRPQIIPEILRLANAVQHCHGDSERVGVSSQRLPGEDCPLRHQASEHFAGRHVQRQGF